jgi:serine protease Do
MTLRLCPPGRLFAAGLWAALIVAWAGTCVAADPPVAEGSDPRRTPVVMAVARAASSVVNIHSVKTSYEDDAGFGPRQGKKVNGMGTGIVIDGRGYIVTNNHVVQGVESLRCTLVDGSTYEATAVAVDTERDLAIIKVEPTRELAVMPLGTSSDLMLGETVVAVGNAFGYEHTVSVGIISALHRDVDVNETQAYKNLIQTDTSINPGNSGGPLLNVRGEVIGINVAIRAGAQRIGFAIPIDDARLAIAELFNTERFDRTTHGLLTEDIKKAADRRLVVRGSASASPASQAGFQPGDIVTEVAGQKVIDRVDLERAMHGRKAGQNVEVVVRRGDESKTLKVTLAPSTAPTQNVLATATTANAGEQAWSVLGLKLGAADTRAVAGTRYRGGLKISAVREGSPAAQNGIRTGDILVGLHQWETVSVDNVDWVLKNPEVKSLGPIKFYIVRGKETLYGHLKLISK